MNDIKIWQHTVPSTGRWHTMVSAGWQGIDEQWLGKSPASADTCYMTMDLWKETSRMASPKLEQHQKMSAPVSRWYREHSDIPHFPISAWALSTLRAPTPNNATVPTNSPALGLLISLLFNYHGWGMDISTFKQFQRSQGSRILIKGTYI